MYNKVTIVGHLGQDPEVRYTQDNSAVATLSVATNERFRNAQGDLQELTEWHRCVAWKKRAEVAQNYLKKGSRVMIEGKLRTRSWEDKAGNKRYTTEINVSNILLMDAKLDSTRPPHPADTSESGPAEPQKRSELPDIDVDDDLPF